MKRDKEVANFVMDEMLNFVDSDGIVLVIDYPFHYCADTC